jgi:hypothetical protein
MLDRGRMNHYRHSGQRPLQPIWIPDVSDEIAQGRVIESRRLHVMLFEFVAAENHQPFGVIVPQQDLDQLLAERSRAARYQ